MTATSFVRPHLLDESAIFHAIFLAGLHPDNPDQIVEWLVDNYTVDLDLLAVVLSTMLNKSLEKETLPQAA